MLYERRCLACRAASSIGDPRGMFTVMTKRVTTFTRANDLSPIVHLRWQRPGLQNLSHGVFAECAHEIRSGPV